MEINFLIWPLGGVIWQDRPLSRSKRGEGWGEGPFYFVGN